MVLDFPYLQTCSPRNPNARDRGRNLAEKVGKRSGHWFKLSIQKFASCYYVSIRHFPKRKTASKWKGLTLLSCAGYKREFETANLAISVVLYTAEMQFFSCINHFVCHCETPLLFRFYLLLEKLGGD